MKVLGEICNDTEAKVTAKDYKLEDYVKDMPSTDVAEGDSERWLKDVVGTAATTSVLAR